MTSPRLYRGRSDRMIFGICGGLAQYFAIDPTIIRLFFVLGAIFSGGAFALAYLIMLFVIPEEPIGAGGAASGSGGPAGSSFFGRSDSGSFGLADDDARHRRHQWIGWGLLGLGLVVLVSNLHLLSWLSFNITWPAFLILAGVYLLLRHRQQL